VHPELCDLLDYQQYVTEVREITHSSEVDHGEAVREGEAYYYFIIPESHVQHPARAVADKPRGPLAQKNESDIRLLL